MNGGKPVKALAMKLPFEQACIEVWRQALLYERQDREVPPTQMTSSEVCSPRQFKSVWRLGELTLAQLARTVFEQITVEQRGVAETEVSASQGAKLRLLRPNHPIGLRTLPMDTGSVG
jgi:hypothetical protein